MVCAGSALPTAELGRAPPSLGCGRAVRAPWGFLAASSRGSAPRRPRNSWDVNPKGRGQGTPYTEIQRALHATVLRFVACRHASWLAHCHPVPSDVTSLGLTSGPALPLPPLLSAMLNSFFHLTNGCRLMFVWTNKFYYCE